METDDRSVDELNAQKKNRNFHPTSFYVSDQQLQKLDDIVYSSNKRNNKRINRNHVVRYLIDNFTEEYISIDISDDK